MNKTDRFEDITVNIRPPKKSEYYCDDVTVKYYYSPIDKMVVSYLSEEDDLDELIF